MKKALQKIEDGGTDTKVTGVVRVVERGGIPSLADLGTQPYGPKTTVGEKSAHLAGQSLDPARKSTLSTALNVLSVQQQASPRST